jgi:hypothetical protein
MKVHRGRERVNIYTLVRCVESEVKSLRVLATFLFNFGHFRHQKRNNMKTGIKNNSQPKKLQLIEVNETKKNKKIKSHFSEHVI